MNKKGWFVLDLFIFAILLFPNTEAQQAQHFNLTGVIVNSTFRNASNTNVTVYVITRDSLGGLVRTWNGTSTTDHLGRFNLTGINASTSVELQVEIKVFNNVTFNVTEVGPPLPPFPSFMIQSYMNNQTFFTQPAITFRLNGTKATGAIQDFNYVVMDTILGSEMRSSITSLVNGTVDVSVPRDRNYTIIFMRNYELTGGTAVPPIGKVFTNTTLYDNSTYERVIPVKVNLSFVANNITGNINLSPRVNASRVNVTHLLVRFLVNGLVPPSGTLDTSSVRINLTDNGNFIANYSISVAGASDGISYLVEAYGNNATGTGPKGLNDEYYAGFANTTVTDSGEVKLNIELGRTKGAYDNSTGEINRVLNTSRNLVRFVNGANSGQEAGMVHIEAKIDLPTGLSYRYMIDRINGSLIREAWRNDSNVTLKILSSQFAPLEKKMNLSQNMTNISLGFFGAEHIKDSSADNITRGNFTGDTGNLIMYMLKNNAECNVAEPSFQLCSLGGAFDQDFNPFQMMTGQKVNMLLKLGNSRVTFIGLDLLSSGPPSSSMSDEQTTKGGSLDSVWKFGSFAPPIYDQLYIGIPYNGSKLNENILPNITLDFLYDNDWEIAWNISQNPGATNVPSAYADYNQSWFNKTGGGVPCSSSSTSAMCFMNTTNNTLWLTLPHFSNFGVNVRASAPVTSNGGSNSGSGSGGSSLGSSDDEDQEEEIPTVEKGETYMVGELDTIEKNYLMAETSVLNFALDDNPYTLTVVSLDDVVTLKIGEEIYTLSVGEDVVIDVTGDGVDDISVTFKGIQDIYAELSIKRVLEEKEDKEAVLTPLEPESAYLWLAILVLGVLILIVYFVTFYRRKRNQKKRRKTKTL